MELMGTQGAPDGFSLGGDFELPGSIRYVPCGMVRLVLLLSNGSSRWFARSLEANQQISAITK